jgi:lactose/L-arabinose transport system ATP-binding protein
MVGVTSPDPKQLGSRRAGFIGSPKMNFLRGKVRRTSASGASVGILGENGPDIAVAVKTVLSAGQEVTVGIRPEHFGGPADAGAKLSLRAEVTELLGDLAYVHAYTAEGEHVVVEKRGDRSIREGDMISLTVTPQKVLLFDIEGARLR